MKKIRSPVEKKRNRSDDFMNGIYMDSEREREK